MRFILASLSFLALLSLCPVKAITLDSTPLYDFANGCPGLINIGLPVAIFATDSYEGDIYTISVITHQVLRLSLNASDMFECSVYGYLPTGVGGVPLGTSFSLGMDIDPDGNIYVSNTGSGNSEGGYGSVWKLSVDSPSSPIVATKIFTSTATNGRPTGLSVVWRHDFLLLSSATDGVIYKIALDGSYSSVWASSTNSVYSLLSGTGRVPGSGGNITNTNLFGVPFGSSPSDVNKNGKKLFVGSADRGVLVSIEINKHDGSAGDLEVVGTSPQHTIEGVYYRHSSKEIYFGGIFGNGTNLTPDGPGGVYAGGVLPGASVWVADLQTGVSSHFYDARLGCVASVSGAKGVLRRGRKKILIADSGFSDFPYWPLGQVRTGSKPYPSGGVDGSTAGYAWTNLPNSAKIWVATV